ncbi:hypothetical protein ACFS07_14055 [Undibacterium arcticum]
MTTGPAKLEVVSIAPARPSKDVWRCAGELSEILAQACMNVQKIIDH